MRALPMRGKRAKAWAPNHASKVLGRLTADVFPWLGSTPIAGITGKQLLETLERVEARGAVDSARRIRHDAEIRRAGYGVICAKTTMTARHSLTPAIS
jgi:hypothetical protein